MTMPMNEGFRLLPVELKFPSAGLLLPHDEFFEKERCICYVCRLRTFHEIRIFIPECQDAARFAADNRIAILDERMKLANVQRCVRAGLFCESFRNHGSA